MNYLRKKLQGLRACADFKGYLREITGAPPLTLTDCMDADLVSLSVAGNAVQDGTPSPDTPIEVQGVGERTANLFDVSQITSKSGGYIQDGDIYVTGYPYITGITPEKFLEMTGLKEGDTVTTYADLTKNTSGVQAIRFDKRSTAPAELNNVILHYYRASQTVTIPKGFNSTNYNQMYIYAGMAEIEPGLRGVYRNVMMVKGSPEEQPSYEPYGYKIPVQISGINLFDAHGIVNNTNNAGVILTEYEGKDCFSFIANASAPKEQWMKGQFKENTQYTFYLNTKSNLGYNIYIIYTDGTSSVMTVGGAIAGDWKVITKTSQAGKTIDYWRGHFNNSNRVYIDLSSSHILEGAYTAETMPPYEPYHEPQTVNVYTDKPLYGQSGEAWSEIVYDGTEDWYANGTSGDGTLVKYLLASQTKIGVAGTRKCVCTHYPKTTHNVADWWEQDTCQAYGFTFQKGWFGICVNITDYPTVDAWKAFLQAQYAAGTPVKAYFAAEESAPAETTAPTYKGTTIISADTAVPPSSMTARYYATQKED